MFLVIIASTVSSLVRWTLGAYIVLHNVIDALAGGLSIWHAVWIAVAVLIVTVRFNFEFEHQRGLATRKVKFSL